MWLAAWLSEETFVNWWKNAFCVWKPGLPSIMCLCGERGGVLGRRGGRFVHFELLLDVAHGLRVPLLLNFFFSLLVVERRGCEEHLGRGREQDGRVVRVSRPRFRELIAAEPDVGDVVMRAFILRRLGILERNFGGAIVV